MKWAPPMEWPKLAGLGASFDPLRAADLREVYGEGVPIYAALVEKYGIDPAAKVDQRRREAERLRQLQVRLRIEDRLRFEIGFLDSQIRRAISPFLITGV